MVWFFVDDGLVGSPPGAAAATATGDGRWRWLLTNPLFS